MSGNDGATPESEAAMMARLASEQCQPAAADPTRQYKHAWSWVWSDGLWTNKIRCNNCLQERTQGV